MTIAEVLDIMTVFDNELQIGASQPQEQKALTALRMAQRHFESVAATFPGILPTQSEISTVASQEYTVWPTALLRLDRLQNLTATGGVPLGDDLEWIVEAGGHVPYVPWPIQQASIAARGGRPYGYTTLKHSRINWQGTPDAVYYIRVTGFHRATVFTKRGDTFQYPDSIADPMAAFAVRLINTGVAEDTRDLIGVASDIFTPVLRQQKRGVRTRPIGRNYQTYHTT